MYNFGIKEIKTNDGSIIIPKQINVIIGPNNSGKSRFLKDLRNTLLNNNTMRDSKIVINDIKYNFPNNKEEFIERYKFDDLVFSNGNGQFCIRNYSGLSNQNFEMDGSMSNYFDNSNIFIATNWRELIEGDCHQFINNYGGMFFNYLGTEEKLLMCKKQRKYGSQDGMTNLLSQVQFNSELLNKLSDYTKKMFNKDIYLDRFSWGDKIIFRVGDNFDFIRKSVRDDGEAEIKLKNYKSLDDEGDGIKSFIANYLVLNLNDKNILLLDEPESFLHPPLAKQLGEIIGKSSNEGKQVFVSTHSVDLLKGILNTCKNVNIIRVTRDEEKNNIYQLDINELDRILSDPLLASANVLNGLFCEKVYITESESDEEFYQFLHNKVNLLESVFFVHGKNKQTLKDIAKIYDSLEVKNYRIYDFDILRDDDFNKALNNFIDQTLKDKYIEIRKKINRKILMKSDYHAFGIRKIRDRNLLLDIDRMFIELKKQGIIILKNGCLETNLEDFNISYTNNKNKWFVDSIKFINEASIKQINESYIYNWIF